MEKAKIFLKFGCVCTNFLNLQFDILQYFFYRESTTRSFKKKREWGGGCERTKSMLSTYFFWRTWSLCCGAPGTPRFKAWGALSAGTERHPHTPGRDWPAAQSLRADTSGQPLPRSSRLLFPALGKKSGQRGDGTKDPAVHGDQGFHATPRLTPGTDALLGRLRVPTRRPRGVVARRAPNRSRHPLLTAENDAHSPRWSPLSSGGSSFLAVLWARSWGPPSPSAEA